MDSHNRSEYSFNAMNERYKYFTERRHDQHLSLSSVDFTTLESERSIYDVLVSMQDIQPKHVLLNPQVYYIQSKPVSSPIHKYIIWAYTCILS